MSIDPSHQLVILARLGEFCQFRGATLHHEQDPWNYMRRKLQETEPALAGLKGELFRSTSKHLLEEIKAGGMDNERYSDYRLLFERLISPGDFADLAIHLTAGQDTKVQLQLISHVLPHLKPTHLFLEERKPPEQRGSAWDKLVMELFRRLDLDRLETVLKRKPRTAKRKGYILRRVRANVAEYCSVVHIPTSAMDTFTPFMLPRIEGLIAANLRFLDRYR